MVQSRRPDAALLHREEWHPESEIEASRISDLEITRRSRKRLGWRNSCRPALRMAPSTPICCIYCECCLATLWAHAEYGISTLWATIRGATEDTQELMSVGAQDAAAPVAEVVLPTPTPTEHSPRFSSAAAEAIAAAATPPAADEGAAGADATPTPPMTAGVERSRLSNFVPRGAADNSWIQQDESLDSPEEAEKRRALYRARRPDGAAVREKVDQIHEMEERNAELGAAPEIVEGGVLRPRQASR